MERSHSGRVRPLGERIYRKVSWVQIPPSPLFLLFNMVGNFKKKNIIKNLKNTYCRLKSSKIHGIGVFAIKDISKNIDPFPGIKKQKWYKLKISDFENFDKEILKMIDDFFVIEKNGNVFIPEVGLNGLDISFFVNHSQAPNLKAIDGEINPLSFITLRKIKKGEELTVCYETFDWKYKKHK